SPTSVALLQHCPLFSEIVALSMSGTFPLLIVQIRLRESTFSRSRVVSMKRLLTSLASVAMLISPFAAHSADLAVKAPPPPPVPVFSWTGFYVGANIGGAWAHNDWTDTRFLTNFNNNNNGVFIGGGQMGANYQIGNFVIGAEWDFDWAGNN